MDSHGLKWTERTKIDPNGPKQTEVDYMNRMNSNRPNRTEMDQDGTKIPKWIEIDQNRTKWTKLALR